MKRFSLPIALFCLQLAALAGEAPAAAPKADAPAVNAEADAIWKDLAEGNKRFVSARVYTREFLTTRTELAKGQHPKVIVLTCSDSRVSPELLFDKNIGDLFVIRTAGNVCDRIALGSIEYAAEHLHSSLLVVLGHEKCGAVAAAASGEKPESKNIKAIVEKIEPALKPMREDGKNADELAAQGVEANILQSSSDVLKDSSVLNKLVEEGKLTVVPALYHLATGEVSRVVPPPPAAAEPKEKKDSEKKEQKKAEKKEEKPKEQKESKEEKHKDEKAKDSVNTAKDKVKKAAEEAARKTE